MKISLFLPHVGVFGGVRRFIELGNAWIRTGHDVTLFHPAGTPPEWLPFGGRVEPLERAGVTDSDLAWCADPHTFDRFLAHRAGRRVYYVVIERDPALPRVLERNDVALAANSTPLRAAVARRAGRAVLDGIGGIDVARFRPDPARRSAAPLRVLINGRRSREKKGTDLVLRALLGLGRRTPAFETVLFDSLDAHNRQDPRDGARLPANARFVINPSQDQLVALYQSADLFVAAERKAGWCNTALEAMACGTAVVCTSSGTRDFARHGETAWVVPVRHPLWFRHAIGRVLADSERRERLGRAGRTEAERWTWDRLGSKLLAQLGAAPAELVPPGRAAAEGPGAAR